ncbi:MAG: Crp/Fnr family transcriptional regulator [Rhodobacterales bacterium]|nr:Crp/Fnr family transcriptional regulator [Rhodobacterales bacterium]
MRRNDQILDRKGFQPGEVIFREGERASVAYVVQTGKVAIVKNLGSKDGSEKILGAVAQGGIFGEMALVDDAVRMASAKAMEATTVIVVSRATFARKLDKADPFLRALLSILSNRIRSLTRNPAPPPEPEAVAEEELVGEAPPELPEFEDDDGRGS